MLAFAVGHYFYIRSVRLRKLFSSLSWLSAEFQDSDISGRQPGIQRLAGAPGLRLRHWYLQLANQTWAWWPGPQCRGAHLHHLALNNGDYKKYSHGMWLIMLNVTARCGGQVWASPGWCSRGRCCSWSATASSGSTCSTPRWTTARWDNIKVGIMLQIYIFLVLDNVNISNRSDTHTALRTQETLEKLMKLKILRLVRYLYF